MATLEYTKSTKKQHIAARKKIYVPMISLTIRGAATHDEETMDKVLHWLDMQRFDYAKSRAEFATVHTARYFS